LGVLSRQARSAERCELLSQTLALLVLAPVGVTLLGGRAMRASARRTGAETEVGVRELAA
jgi:hypothetical protein